MGIDIRRQISYMHLAKAYLALLLLASFQIEVNVITCKSPAQNPWFHFGLSRRKRWLRYKIPGFVTVSVDSLSAGFSVHLHVCSTYRQRRWILYSSYKTAAPSLCATLRTILYVTGLVDHCVRYCRMEIEMRASSEAESTANDRKRSS